LLVDLFGKNIFAGTIFFRHWSRNHPSPKIWKNNFCYFALK